MNVIDELLDSAVKAGRGKVADRASYREHLAKLLSPINELFGASTATACNESPAAVFQRTVRAYATETGKSWWESWNHCQTQHAELFAGMSGPVRWQQSVSSMGKQTA